MINMNHLRFTKQLSARYLMQDDWFRLAGNICRVTTVEKHDKQLNLVRFSFRILGEPPHLGEHDLTVGWNTKFKVYNQK